MPGVTVLMNRIAPFASRSTAEPVIAAAMMVFASGDVTCLMLPTLPVPAVADAGVKPVAVVTMLALTAVICTLPLVPATRPVMLVFSVALTNAVYPTAAFNRAVICTCVWSVDRKTAV